MGHGKRWNDVDSRVESQTFGRRILRELAGSCLQGLQQSSHILLISFDRKGIRPQQLPDPRQLNRL